MIFSKLVEFTIGVRPGKKYPYFNFYSLCQREVLNVDSGVFRQRDKEVLDRPFPYRSPTLTPLSMNNPKQGCINIG